MDSNAVKLDVIAEFADGRVIPRRVRYYDINSAEYVEKDIVSIYYEVADGRQSQYGIRFSGDQSGILSFYRATGRWQLVQHL